jgi:hypothetical protein
LRGLRALQHWCIDRPLATGESRGQDDEARSGVDRGAADMRFHFSIRGGLGRRLSHALGGAPRAPRGTPVQEQASLLAPEPEGRQATAGGASRAASCRGDATKDRAARCTGTLQSRAALGAASPPSVADSRLEQPTLADSVSRDHVAAHRGHDGASQSAPDRGLVDSASWRGGNLGRRSQT